MECEVGGGGGGRKGWEEEGREGRGEDGLGPSTVGPRPEPGRSDDGKPQAKKQWSCSHTPTEGSAQWRHPLNNKLNEWTKTSQCRFVVHLRFVRWHQKKKGKNKACSSLTASRCCSADLRPTCSNHCQDKSPSLRSRSFMEPLSESIGHGRVSCCTDLKNTHTYIGSFHASRQRSIPQDTHEFCATVGRSNGHCP